MIKKFAILSVLILYLQVVVLRLQKLKNSQVLYFEVTSSGDSRINYKLKTNYCKTLREITKACFH